MKQNLKTINCLIIVFALFFVLLWSPRASFAAECSASAQVSQLACESSPNNGHWTLPFCDCSNASPTSGCKETNILDQSTCRTYGGVWGIGICDNCASGMKCDQSNNEPPDGENLQNCGTDQTCDSSNHCIAIAAKQQCDPKNNVPQNNNNDTKDCGINQSCDANNRCVGLPGANCASNPNLCQPGLNCINSVCASPQPTQNNPTTPTNPTTPVNPTAPSGSTCNKGSCPEGLCSVNGLCLPPAPYTTGVAGSTSLVDLLTKIIQILLTFAGIIAVVMLVIGGYWYMASGGNEEQAEKGKKTILNFVLGLVIIILAYTIVTVLSNTLTANQLTK